MLMPCQHRRVWHTPPGRVLPQSNESQRATFFAHTRPTNSTLLNLSFMAATHRAQ